MTGRDSDVAVIGVSFELPACSTWADLDSILRRGADTVAIYPQSRVDAMGLERSAADAEGCWQPDLGQFDHQYFGLSRADAELIDPRQRRMLTLAVSAMLSAGYPPPELRGANVAVLIAGYCGIQPSLIDLLPHDEQVTGRAFAGSLPAYSAGRLAYHLDLRGPALVIDTACSSFLVAMHEARWKLARSESELALVGGYAAILGAIPSRPVVGEGMGVNSPTNRCLPFDSEADGIVIGEGGGFVLLKRLDAARRDGDVVHAVLRGSALNQDAARSNGLSSPSPTAQAEVITAALRDAGVDAETVGYIEAHGTGTRVGDPIEMQALIDTYGGRPTAGGSRPVSTAKANFGHLDAMSGLAGLLRIIAQFRARRFFPTANFTTLNPLIDLGGVALHVNDTENAWDEGPHPRRAGLSSFGLSGTNAHFIVEEPSPLQEKTSVRPSTEHVVVLSAPTANALRVVVGQLRDRLSHDAPQIEATAHLLALGREHLAYRHAWLVRGNSGLIEQLDLALGASADVVACPAAPGPLVLVLGEPRGPGRKIDSLDPSLVVRAERHRPRDCWTTAQRRLVTLISDYTVLLRHGVRFDVVLAHGVGVMARKVAEGDSGLEAAMDSVMESSVAPDRERLAQALGAVTGGDERPVLINFAPSSALSYSVAGLSAQLDILGGQPSVGELVRLLFLKGYVVDWRTSLGEIEQRIELPVPRLAESDCWLPVRSAETRTCSDSAEKTKEVPPGSTVETTVLQLTRELLKSPASLDDDYFDLGGNSLNGTLLVARLNALFGTDLEVMDLFDLTDLRSLAVRIKDLGGASTALPASTQLAPVAQTAPLSGQQTAIWAATMLDPESDAYSVPAAFRVLGPLDVEGLAGSLRTLVGRHAMLRCILEDVDGTPHHRIVAHQDDEVLLEHLEWDFTHLTTGDGGMATLMTSLGDLVRQPFRPYAEPSRRFHLVRARFEDDEQLIVVLNFHHLFFDGMSWDVVLDELGSRDPRLPLERSYLDHVREQAGILDGERGRTLHDFWTQYLDGVSPGALQTDRLDAASLGSGADISSSLTETNAARLRQLCAEQRSSLNMVFLAAWAILLWQDSGDSDVCVAMPVANRRPGDDGIVGCFVNTVLVRVRIDTVGTFGHVLAQVRGSSLRATAHGDFPTDMLLRSARHPSGQPLAVSMLGLQSPASWRRLGDDGPLVEPLDLRQQGAQFPLELSVIEESSAIEVSLKYDTSLFRRATALRWLTRVERLISLLADQGVGLEIAPHDPGESAGLPDFKF